MARLPLLLLMLAAGPALAAQTTLTVAQFETSSLPALHAMRDSKAASALAGMKLSERAGLERAARWQTEMPGKDSAEALMALVDASAFLDAPAQDILPTPPPAVEEQKQILTRAATALGTMLAKLPDFYAVRSTTHFETAEPDRIGIAGPFSLTRERIPRQELGPLDRKKPSLGQLFFLSETTQSETYRDGLEVEGPVTGTKDGVRSSAFTLTTSGEFGPILRMVLIEALERGMTWSHWEQGANNALAVFHYDVPKDRSQYEIGSLDGGTSYFPAYRGELTIDPASGAILRITIQASSPADSRDLLDSSIVVEYGPVDIGGRTYICPVHGVAITTTRGRDEPEEKILLFPRPRFLNDVRFSGYHVFRAETRILPAQ
jgi:hypothetical protein